MKTRIKLILGSVGLAAVIAGAVSFSFGQTPPPISPHLRLKAPKTDILGSKKFISDDGKFSVKYAYNSRRRISDTPGVLVEKAAGKARAGILTELKDRRTKHARTFATAREGVFITEVIAGVPQYYKDPQGRWWEADYATTTEEAFLQQTRLTSLEKIARILTPEAWAVTDTFFPDPNPETTSQDCEVVEAYAVGSGISWATIIANPGNTVSNDQASGSWFNFRSDTGTDLWRVLNRGIVLFDTSSIPDANTTDSSTLSLFGTAKADPFTNTPNINVYSSAPASNTDCVAGDYDSLGSTAFSTAITFANWSTTAYNDFALNSSGLANISKTGVSKFGIRNANYDVAAVAPTWGSNDRSYMEGYFAEQTGTANDPKLVVTHSAPPAAGEEQFPEIMIFD